MQKSHCKVSVIVPVYKVEDYLCRCVDSLLAQTLKDIEIILVDDGSPDNSPAICDEYATRDGRISVVHKRNEGVLRARQSGLERASAPYVGFLDSDDFASPDMFETLYNEAVRTDADVVSCSYVRYWTKEKQQRDARSKSLTGVYSDEQLDRFYSRFFFDNTPKSDRECIPPLVWNKLFRRELIAEVHQKLSAECSGITIGEDMLVSYSCLLRAKKISVLGEFYPVYYFDRPGSVLNSFKSNYLQNNEILLEQLGRMEAPVQSKTYLQGAIRRYASYTAVRIVLDIVPPDTSFVQRLKATARVIKHMQNSPLWGKLLLDDGADLFEYGFEKLIYRLMRKGMPTCIVLCIWLHELKMMIRNGK